MVKRDELAATLDEILTPELFEDSTYNGLQIEGKEEIEKVGFAVDSCLEVFQDAAKQKCDLLITHHGLIWGSWKRIGGNSKARLQTLLKNGISLYVSHLPLDAHPEYGNNARIISALGGECLEPFNRVGFFTEFDYALEIKELKDRIQTSINDDLRSMEYGPKETKKIAVCSGSLRPSAVSEALWKGADTIISGEGSSDSLFYYTAKEEKLNIFFAGHYATETFGVKALQELIESRYKSLKTVFLDHPTGW